MMFIDRLRRAIDRLATVTVLSAMALLILHAVRGMAG